jgi:hypothetical protein
MMANNDTQGYDYFLISEIGEILCKQSGIAERVDKIKYCKSKYC